MAILNNKGSANHPKMDKFENLSIIYVIKWNKSFQQFVPLVNFQFNIINFKGRVPWSRERTFARRPGGLGSNPAYSFFLFSDFEEQLENVERSILSIAESGSVVKRKKSRTRTRKMTSFEPRPRGTGRSYSYK